METKIIKHSNLSQRIYEVIKDQIINEELAPGERLLDDKLASSYGFHEREDKPRIHSDNGSQMKAKSLKAFLKELGILNEYSRPHVPEDQAVLERFFRTIKQGEVYHHHGPAKIPNGC